MNIRSQYYWPNFWYHKIKVNVIPFDTKNRRSVLESYVEYQDKRIPLEIFNQWLEKGLFDYGMAIFPGKIYSEDPGPELFLVVLDFDKKEGFEELCNFDSKAMTREEWAEKTILEQHLDDLNRSHTYILSPIPFPNKGPDSKIGLEVKSKGEHGIMFSSDSPHKNGHRYQIIGTKEPWILNKVQALKMIQYLDGICKRHGLTYLDKKSSVNPNLKRMIKSLKIDQKADIAINHGERHPTLLTIANSILFHHLEKAGENVDMLKVFFQEINQVFCHPEPLPSEEIDSIWNSSIDYVKANKDFDTDMRSKPNDLDKEAKAEFIERATETILENHQFLTLEESKEVLYYQNGVYVSGGEILIEKISEYIFGYEIANKHLTEIKGHIIRKTYRKRLELDSDLDIINLQNRLYSISKNELRPHTPDYLSINQKPIVYDPTLKPKLLWNFLKDVLYSTEIRTAIEAMAYTFYRDYPYEYYFKLFGYGANGKSVFTGLLTGLHDIKNVSNVSISSLMDHRFALSDLEFKDVNVDTEFSHSAVKDTSILKKLTGGRKQPIRIERKNQHAYDTYLHAKLFFNANSLKELAEKTNADYRREVIISFPNTFVGKKDDPQLLQKLKAQEEKSGIFNVLMIALRRLLKNNGIFMNEKTIEERRRKSERVADPIKSFLEEAVTEDSIETDWIVKSEFHSAYVRFCKKYKIAHKSIEVFSKELLKIVRYDEGKKTINKERKTCWFGVKLNPQYLLSEEQQVLDV